MEFVCAEECKKRRVFARIFDITMNIIISGDTNDHRGMRIQERKGGRGGGEKEEMRRYRPRREARMITRSETQKVVHTMQDKKTRCPKAVCGHRYPCPNFVKFLLML